MTPPTTPQPAGPHPDPARLRVLHAVRLLGFADTDPLAARAGTTPDRALDVLRGAEHEGWVRYVSFADLGGWSLTDAGTTENERLLAQERLAADSEGMISSVHTDFRPLNARLLRAATDWQLLSATDGRLTPNDHEDAAWDGRVLDELESLGAALRPLVTRLTHVLPRFAGYDERFAAALRLARAGDTRWVSGTDVDSCHRAWFELHEDLLATLGIERGQERGQEEESDAHR